LQIYVAFRETMDALLKRQQDPVKFPAWLMNHPVKKTERHIHILRAKANPKPIAAAKGSSEMWFPQWLAEIEDDGIHASLVGDVLICSPSAEIANIIARDELTTVAA
jgi:hypothetical protein